MGWASPSDRVTLLQVYSVSPLPEDRWSSGNGHVFGNTAYCAELLVLAWVGRNPPDTGPLGSAAQRVGKRGFRLSATKPGFPPLRVRFGVRPVFGRTRRSGIRTAEFAIPPTHPTVVLHTAREGESACVRETGVRKGKRESCMRQSGEDRAEAERGS